MQLTKYSAPAPAGKASLLVDLGDAGSFLNEQSLATKRIFGFQITNNNAATQQVILTPSYNPSNPNRVIRDGVIPYAVGAVDLTAASINTKTIAEILAFIQYHPTRILFLQVESNISGQLTQQMTITPKSAFTDPETEKINLASFKSPQYPNDKIVIVKKEHFQLDIDTEIGVNIPPLTQTTFSFYCGGVWNSAETLYKLGVSAANGQ